MRLLAAAALAFCAACSSSADPAPSAAPLPTPAEVHAAAAAARTVRFTLTTTIETPGGEVVSTTTGRADLAKQVAIADVVFDPATNVYDVAGHGVVRTATHAYLRTTGGWVRFPLPADEAARGPAMSPMLPYDLLPDATRDWRAVGEEVLDGVPVRHVHGQGDRAGVDVWVTSDSRPVRIDAVIPTPAKMTMRLDLRSYGEALDARAPGTARDVADVDAAFEAVGLA